MDCAAGMRQATNYVMGVGNFGGNMDITQLDLDDLLSAIEDRNEASANMIDKWLKEEGYYPGSTRISASELYKRFMEWYRQLPEQERVRYGKLPNISAWGKWMIGRFRSTRTNKCRMYYISRQESVEI